MKVNCSVAQAASTTVNLPWRRTRRTVLSLCVLVMPAQAIAFTLQFGNDDTIQTPVVGDVQSFQFTVEIDAPLAAGVYENPPLIQIDYQVSGEPVVGSPSGFPAFALERSISGADFYQTGNLLVFEIADTAVLSDGVQAAELVGDTIILSFDAREVDTGRFHPARFELRADGTGQLQNSDNVPDISEPDGIPVGSEYITDIAFDPGNLTLFVADDTLQPDPEPVDNPDAEAGQPDVIATDDTATSSSDPSGGGTGLALLLLLTSHLFGRLRFGGASRRCANELPID